MPKPQWRQEISDIGVLQFAGFHYLFGWKPVRSIGEYDIIAGTPDIFGREQFAFAAA
jgi:hypothetical protein